MVIMEEKPLFKCQFNSLHYIYEQLTVEQRTEYSSLSCYRELDQHIIAAIFLTNRYETRTPEYLKGFTDFAA